MVERLLSRHCCCGVSYVWDTRKLEPDSRLSGYGELGTVMREFQRRRLYVKAIFAVKRYTWLSADFGVFGRGLLGLVVALVHAKRRFVSRTLTLSVSLSSAPDKIRVRCV